MTGCPDLETMKAKMPDSGEIVDLETIQHLAKEVKQVTTDVKWLLIIMAIVLMLILFVVAKMDILNIPTKVVEIWRWTRGLG